jgi:hypothetical protein
MEDMSDHPPLLPYTGEDQSHYLGGGVIGRGEPAEGGISWGGITGMTLQSVNIMGWYN